MHQNGTLWGASLAAPMPIQGVPHHRSEPAGSAGTKATPDVKDETVEALTDGVPRVAAAKLD